MKAHPKPQHGIDVDPIDLDAVKRSGENCSEKSAQLLAEHRERTEAEFLAELRKDAS